MTITIRLATLADCERIVELIDESARGLGSDDYSQQEIEAALRTIWGLDTQLIHDGTYFVCQRRDRLAACGGWSFRRTLFGSDANDDRNPERLDPSSEPARIRAFFVHPDFARQGIGTRLLDRCEAEARAAGFDSLMLGATAPGQRLYARHGFSAREPIECDLGNGMSMSVVPMTKKLRPMKRGSSNQLKTRGH